MATLYAVLITGNNNWSATTTWSTTADGLGVPAGPPDATTDVAISSICQAGATLTVDATANCKDMDWTGATNTPTLTMTNRINCYGSWTFILAMTVNGTNTSYFGATSGSHTITLAGKSFPGVIQFSGTGGTWSFMDDITSAGIWYWAANNSIINTNNHTITCGGKIGWSYNATRTLNAGTSVINTTEIDCAATIGLTINGTPTFNCSGNFSGGGLNWNIVNLTGATSTITGSNTFAEFNLASGTTQTITFTDGTTQAVRHMTRDAGTSLKTLAGSGNGSWKLINLRGTPIVLDYISVSKGKFFPPKAWYARYSRNGGNNTGLNFGMPSRRNDLVVIE